MNVTDSLLDRNQEFSSSGQTKDRVAVFTRLGKSLYRKCAGGVIYARVRVNGRLTWRSTETNNPVDSRKWLAKWKHERWAAKNGFELQGTLLHHKRVTLRELIAAYEEAGYPSRMMRSKAPATTRNEKFFLNPIRAYFGDTMASALTLADCDNYRDWRLAGGYVSCYKTRGGNPRIAKTSGGNRSVDLELTVLSNVFNFAIRRNVLKSNPLVKRGRYVHASEVRHCREVAPTPESLKKIEIWLREGTESAIADLVCFLAFSGLRIGEALPMTWGTVNWSERVLHVTREKRGTTPWVPILREMEMLLKDMKKRAASDLLFPSPLNANKPRDASAVRRRIARACRKLQIGHVTPHGLRSYFVTQARQSGVTDAEIAALIGDKSGAAIIASTYGDIRPDYLFTQAQRIRLTIDS